MSIEKTKLKIVDTSKPTVKTGRFLVNMWTNYHIEIERDWSGMTDEAIQEVFMDEFDESFDAYEGHEVSDLEVVSFDIEHVEKAKNVR